MPPPRRNDARRPEPFRAGHGSDKQPRDAGAYIGRLPEREAETIPGGLGPKDELIVDIAALYWHFVDVVWIAIFTLVYLIK